MLLTKDILKQKEPKKVKAKNMKKYISGNCGPEQSWDSNLNIQQEIFQGKKI